MDERFCGVALGNFDGVHLGHRTLLERLKEKSKELNCSSMVFTFKQHPQNVLNKNSKLPLIYPADIKREIIEGIGIDFIEMCDFTKDLSIMEPEKFLREVLLKRFPIKYIVVGFNYRFGHNGRGDIEFLTGFGQREGIPVEVVDPVCVDGEVVSSSLIRKLLLSGDIKRANRYLGGNFFIRGEVKRGDGRGKGMGFPTANIDLSQDLLLPAKGVYITHTNCRGASFPSITNVGIKPTFSGNKMVIETNIRGLNEEIYNEVIQIEFIDRIRDEKKFENKEELKKQLELDLEYMENYLYINK
ncbi:MAG: FMN adenylyltransferase / Riboflavin kinase [Firmicutes bacterium]|nr:FMN adenylyltransferase / Riboflavin kinase [Bacillota bacterium]MDI6704724.1 bifunctional riboflavin kinase/FAD synthetase [Bacillota bacterium]